MRGLVIAILVATISASLLAAQQPVQLPVVSVTMPKAPCPPPAAEKERLLNLPFQAFDQDMQGGWRIYDYNQCESDAAALIDAYLARHQLGLMQEGLLRFHIFQMIADIDRKTAMRTLAKVEDIDRRRNAPPAWTLYERGTRAFMEGNNKALNAMIAAMAAHVANDGSNLFTAKTNLNVLRGLAQCFGRPYSEAYGCGDRDDRTRINKEMDANAAIKTQARLQSDRGDLAGAAETYGKALATWPHDMDLLARRAIVHAKAGHTTRAEQDFASARAVANSPNDLNALCWTKAAAGVALESALVDCNAALKKDPRNAEYLDSRGFVLLRLGRYDQAIADYDRALASIAMPDGSRFGRAVARARKGDNAGSDADLAAALKANANIRAEYKSYGITL